MLIWGVAIIILFFGFVVFWGAPYVPSKKKDITNTFTNLYHLNKDDCLVDIGSGDGVVLRFASRIGARAVGYEIQPLLFLISKIISLKDKNITVKYENFWHARIPDDTTVVYTFGDGRDIKKMYRLVSSESLRLKKTIIFISYAFKVPGVAIDKSNKTHFLYKINP